MHQHQNSSFAIVVVVADRSAWDVQDHLDTARHGVDAGHVRRPRMPTLPLRPTHLHLTPRGTVTFRISGSNVCHSNATN